MSERTGSSGSRSRSSSAKKSTAGSRGSTSSAQSNVNRVQAARNGSSNSRTSRRKKKRGPDPAQIILIIVGILIIILCVAVGVRSCSRSEKDEETADEMMTEPETEIEADIVINGISINGLTKSEARDAILSSINWEMKVSYGDEVRSLANFMEYSVDQTLDEAFDSAQAKTYSLSTDGLEETVSIAAAELAAEWDKPAKISSVTSFDSSSNDFVFSPGEDGVEIDQDKLVYDIMDRIKAGDYGATIAVTADIVAPEISDAEARATFKRIGTFTTTTTSNSNRNNNIRIASEALNGLIIQPGEEFSFNQTTGNRTEEKGYKAAGAYQNGEFVEEPGGGVCQVSSTLYNAVVFSGLTPTERHAHTYEPSYVTPGEDAMVSYDGYSGPDMKFVNTSSTAIGIKTSFSNQELTISIYGNPILEDGVALSMHSEKTADIDPPSPIYEEDPYLAPGEEEVVTAATNGSTWRTNLVTTKDGVVISDEFFHSSTYSGKAATIKRNTSGVQLTPEGEIVSEEETDEEEADGEETDGDVVISPAETEAPASPAETEASDSSLINDGPGYDSSASEVQQSGPGTIIEPSEASVSPTTAAFEGPSSSQTETSISPAETQESMSVILTPLDP